MKKNIVPIISIVCAVLVVIVTVIMWIYSKSDVDQTEVDWVQPSEETPDMEQPVGDALVESIDHIDIDGYKVKDTDGDGYVTKIDAQLDGDIPKKKDNAAWTPIDFVEVDLEDYAWFDWVDYGSYGQMETLWAIAVAVDDYYDGNVDKTWSFDDAVDLSETYNGALRAELHSDGLMMEVYVDLFNGRYMILF